MKPCYAAALALVGWYLMMPWMHNKVLIDDSAPLSQWTYLDSFDSAARCDQVRRGLTQYAKGQMDKKLAAFYGPQRYCH